MRSGNKRPPPSTCGATCPAKGEGQARLPATLQALPTQREGGAAKAALGRVQRTEGANRIFSSPLARRLAKEAGLDLNRVQGSGPHGRVIARDIDAAKSGKGLRAPGAARGGRRRCRWRRRPPTRRSARCTKTAATISCRTTDAQDDRAAADAVEADHPAFLSHASTATSAGCWPRARKSTRPRPRTRTASLPTSFRSTTSSSRRWRWRCNACRTPMSPGPKPACSITSIPTSASRWRCPAG